MLDRFRHRSYELERIDTGDHTAAEYARWQREMPLIHGFFGEKRALRNSLLAEIRSSGGPKVSLLDVGAGSGQLLSTFRTWLSDRDAFMVGAEINAEAASAIGVAGMSAVRCDGTRLPFADDSFDHAFSTLTLHHLSDEDAKALVGEMGRVSRGRIFIVDLNRNPAAYYVYRLLAPLALQKLTVEDGALSILRSFKADELELLAADAGLVDIRVDRSRFNRLILSGHKQ